MEEGLPGMKPADRDEGPAGDGSAVRRPRADPGSPTAEVAPRPGARALVLSQRRAVQSLAYTGWSEGEDVLVGDGGGDIHLLAPATAPTKRVRALVGRSLRRITSTNTILPPVGRGNRVEGRYDVAVAVLRTVWDLPTVEAVPGLRSAADRLVGWFPEAWPPELTDKLALHPFSLLDEIFVGEPRSAERLADLLGRPVHFLPLATDVEVFSDGVATSGDAAVGDGRPIHVLNIGRRDPDLHAALIRWSRSTGHYYVFDTLSGGVAPDRPAHRRALADQLQRTSVSISSYAKQGQAETGGIRWVPARVFDNLASGTILAGSPPEEQAQRELFGREVVHRLPDDGEAAVKVIADLVSSASADERARNVRTALAGHDWSHRWVALLETCGLTPRPALVERAARLRRRASPDPTDAP